MPIEDGLYYLLYRDRNRGVKIKECYYGKGTLYHCEELRPLKQGSFLFGERSRFCFLSFSFKHARGKNKFFIYDGLKTKNVYACYSGSYLTTTYYLISKNKKELIKILNSEYRELP